MRPRYFTGIVLILLITGRSLFASQQALSVADKPSSYDKEWKAVDSLSNQGLPKSALEIVNKIYKDAKSGKNDAQYVKSIIYRIKLQSDFREDALLKSIYEVRTEIRSADKPVVQILNSILAELYWRYYQQNRYRFRDRTKISGMREDSVQTWDLTTLSGKITAAYLLSLSDRSELTGISIREYEPVIEIPDAGEKESRSLEMTLLVRPTLYDFLAWRALDYFMNPGTQEHISGNAFGLDDPAFFSQTGNFINMKFLKAGSTPDTMVQTWYALSIFRDLAALHFKNNEPGALIDEELKRLEYVHGQGVMEAKDSLYLTALKQFKEQYRSSPYSTDISFAIAQFLSGTGEQYKPLASASHKWDRKEASAICEEAFQHYPGSNGAKNCRILFDVLTKTQEFQVTTENAVIPDQPFLGKLEFRNVKTVNFRLYRTDAEACLEKLGSSNKEDQISYIEHLPILSSWPVTLPNDSDLQKHSVEFPVMKVPAGFYVLLCSAEPTTGSPVAKTYTTLFSTHLSYVSGMNEQGGRDIFLPDRETGKPLKGVSAEAFTKNYDYNSRSYKTQKTGDYLSDENGMIRVPGLPANSNSRNFFLKLRQKDELYITSGFYQFPKVQADQKGSFQTFFFTDRAIYRPGQIIYFKGIVLEKTGDLYLIKPDVKTTVVFTNVNGQKIAEQTFTVNDFGSFNGSFTAPQGVLTGRMTLSNGSGSAIVSVEEYKRPTFDVTYDPLQGNYHLDDELTVSGRAMAFAGNSVDGATVNYRVVRAVRFPYYSRWWMPFPASPETEIAHGTLKTDADGHFSILFRAIPDKSVNRADLPVFDYTVSADVTDINGETRSGTTSVAVGYVSQLIGTNIPDKVNLTNDSLFKITTTNLNGQKTPARVTLTLQYLHQPRLLKPGIWERPDLSLLSKDEFEKNFPSDAYGDEDRPEKWDVEETVYEKTLDTSIDSTFGFRMFATHEPTGDWNLSSGKPLKQGYYRLIMKATDPFGQPVESNTFFTVFNPTTKSVAMNSMNWFVPLKTTCNPGDKASFLIGTAEKNVTVLYEIRMRDSLVSRQFINLSANQVLVDVPVKEEYRGNFAVNFVFARNNRVFQNNVVVTVPYANKKLDITFSTFRNKLLPGQKEEWKINIRNADKKGVAAEFLAAMYDASLDEFAANSWNFDLYRNYFYHAGWDVADAFRVVSGKYYPAIPPGESYRFNIFGNLNWFGFNFPGSGRFGGMSGKMMLERNASDAAEPMNADGKSGIVEKTINEMMVSPVPEINVLNAAPEKHSVQVRRDFRETAFFYPSLLTDADGNVTVSFTIPESLTKWKLLGFAHTKDLEYGQIVKSFVTQKELMVFPNAPRFVRQGDTVVFSTKVSNLSDRTLSGGVLLELEDGITGNPLDFFERRATNDERRKIFTGKPGESVSVSWKLFIPVDGTLNMLKYRITAQAGDFSDGEEKAIPVLTNRMLVTESLPLPVNGAGTFNFTFDKLLKTTADPTLKNYKLTLEFASNPAWYAIQALPTLDDPQYPNADNLFNAFYANSIASFIANSSPKIRQVFDSWKATTPDALLSNLEKNQELKSAVLEETPWVKEATSESARKQRIALLFDLNTIGNRLNQSLQKLQKLQSSNGGWPWFEGMQENRFITQEIITGLGHLDHLGIRNIQDDKPTWEMVVLAIRYLDGEMADDYNDIKKHDAAKMDENHLSGTEIQYLYARTYFLKDLPVTNGNGKGQNATEAFSYFRRQAERYWTQNNIYFQGMIALALNRLGNKSIPGAVLRSLSEKALHSPETGMYWAYNSGFAWFEAPVETQALLIEAYDEVLADQKSVNEMKNWLLKQKQTRDWKTSRATAEACYALLLKGSNLLEENPKVILTMGNETIDPSTLQDTKVEAGTGYFQVSRDGKQIDPSMGKVTVTKTGEGLAWGAVYWQYFEQLDKITPAQTPLKITKELYLERNTGKGPVLEKMTDDGCRMSDGRCLNVGDKVKVRIILTVDRTLEYVHMKDMRASAFEPAVQQLSGYRYQDGLGYYQSTSDAATNFFFEYLPKGTYVFEYPLVVNAAGNYSNGITTVQCMYAPEFGAHSEGIRVVVK